MRRFQAVAIGTQDAEVFESIVVPIAVHVIQFEGKITVVGAARPPALLTRRSLQASREQSLLQLEALDEDSLAQQFVERPRRPWSDDASASPRPAREMFGIDSGLVNVLLDLRVVPSRGAKTVVSANVVYEAKPRIS
jgi:hypothetical protein